MPLLLLIGLSLLPAPPGAADMATRLGLATVDIASIEPVALNRQPLGHLVRFARKSNTYGQLVSLGTRRLSLGEVDTFDPRGIIDLAGAGPLPMGRSLARSLEAENLADPAWVLITRRTEPASATPQKKRGRFRSRPATQETLHLIRLRDWTRVLKVRIKRRSDDGFGGHDIAGLTLKRAGDVVEITGTRQDHLPARRARCMKPPPVPVRYVMRDGAFRQVDGRDEVRCGRSPVMPKVKGPQ